MKMGRIRDPLCMTRQRALCFEVVRASQELYLPGRQKQPQPSASCCCCCLGLKSPDPLQKSENKH